VSALTQPQLAPPDDESRDWLASLTADPRGEGLVRLRTHLLCAAQFEVARRRDQVLHVDEKELDELARIVADSALMRLIAHLDDYRAGSRFTTWAAKFAISEAAVRLRKLAWHEAHTSSSTRRASKAELSPELHVTVGEMTRSLSDDQRHVFEALTVRGVPIDVLAEDLGRTRNDVYQTLQAARCTLRERLTGADSA
jgi:RNA polymerase sigma-70 factor, ECF subfamily